MDSLPPELHHQLCEYLPQKDLPSYRLVNRVFSDLLPHRNPGFPFCLSQLSAHARLGYKLMGHRCGKLQLQQVQSPRHA
ncbi:hypothetical protein CC86DRAFT_454890 [Ophiobolus disseminans]|uniref:F-box domain-containing protein n=1 Tax=Ophiobolus disseminans TaxID=1469910 RepID=A0A6A7A4M4_9PLEO|nr:hypothetical protein CC86DRAFT_454890 [Ophiobolus disseminans]